MAGRPIRLKRAELRLLRISELRRLMDALGVSGEGARAWFGLAGHGSKRRVTGWGDGIFWGLSNSDFHINLEDWEIGIWI